MTATVPGLAVAGVLATLRSVHASGRTRDPRWRQRQLEGIARLVENEEARIAQALEADLGRNAVECWLGEIASTKAEADYARKHVRRWMRRRRSGLPLTQLPARAWIQYEPLGVALIIGPWNYPFYLTLGPLVAAVAAGNCAVIKPSELAPRASELLAELIPKYLDPDAVKVVEGGAQTTQDLLAAGFDHALFTGGTEVGRKIMAAAAPTLTPVTLELGGKSPVVVAPDADLEVVARRLLWVKLMNSGQTCIAPDYVLVHKDVTTELVSTLKSVVDEFRAGQPRSMRVVNERQHARLARYLQSTSGTVVCGGEVSGDLEIAPTIVLNPASDEPMMCEEIFGPILPVIEVDTVDDAIVFINERAKPLAVYVFTGSKDLARRVVDDVPAGGAVINHVAMHCMVPNLPFGGVGASGMGGYHGRWGFEAMSHRKSVLAKASWPDPNFMYPPYTDRAVKLFRRMF